MTDFNVSEKIPDQTLTPNAPNIAIMSCIFYRLHSFLDGGAISITNYGIDNLKIIKSTFMQCQCLQIEHLYGKRGGAIFSRSKNCSIFNCVFDQCNADVVSIIYSKTQLSASLEQSRFSLTEKHITGFEFDVIQALKNNFTSFDNGNVFDFKLLQPKLSVFHLNLYHKIKMEERIHGNSDIISNCLFVNCQSHKLSFYFMFNSTFLDCKFDYATIGELNYTKDNYCNNGLMTSIMKNTSNPQIPMIQILPEPVLKSEYIESSKVFTEKLKIISSIRRIELNNCYFMDILEITTIKCTMSSTKSLKINCCTFERCVSGVGPSALDLIGNGICIQKCNAKSNFGYISNFMSLLTEKPAIVNLISIDTSPRIYTVDNNEFLSIGISEMINTTSINISNSQVENRIGDITVGKLQFMNFYNVQCLVNCIDTSVQKSSYMNFIHVTYNQQFNKYDVKYSHLVFIDSTLPQNYTNPLVFADCCFNFSSGGGKCNAINMDSILGFACDYGFMATKKHGLSMVAMSLIGTVTTAVIIISILLIILLILKRRNNIFKKRKILEQEILVSFG